MRHRFLMLLVIAACLHCTVNVRAALLLYEPFDYSGSSISGQGGNELGLSNTWADNVAKPSGAFGTVGSVSLSNDATSLGRLGLLASQGARLDDTAGGTAKRPLNGFSINMNTNAVHYVSALIRGEGILQFDGVHTDSNDYVRAAVGIDRSVQGQEFLVGGFSGSIPNNYSRTGAYAGGKTYQADETYLLVAKIQTVNGSNDLFDLKIYDTTMGLNYSEPSTFDLSASNSSAVNLDHLFIGFNGVGEIDEIRVGTTWGDVVPVPEPSTVFALLTLAGMGLLGCSRRRRRNG